MAAISVVDSGHFNPAHTDDIRAHLSVCYAEAYRGVLNSASLSTLIQSLSSDTVGGILPNVDETLLMYRKSDAVIGSAVYALRQDRAYLWGFYVRASAQRRGIGTALLQEVSGRIPNEATLDLTVLNGSTDAVAFYKTAGFALLEETTFEFCPDTTLPASRMTASNTDLFAPDGTRV